MGMDVDRCLRTFKIQNKIKVGDVMVLGDFWLSSFVCSFHEERTFELARHRR